MSQIIGADTLHVFFTKRTLKHIAEKGSEGKRLITLIPCILRSPDVLFKGKSNRFICVKYFSNVERELQVVVIEFVNNTAIIVTSFVSDEKYLKNFEILWRTGTSLS